MGKKFSKNNSNYKSIENNEDYEIKLKKESFGTLNLKKKMIEKIREKRKKNYTIFYFQIYQWKIK